MTQSKGALRWGAIFAVISAGLCAIAPFLSGFSVEALLLLPAAIVFAGFAYGLLRGWRWLAYIAFMALFVGAIFAISNIWAPGAVPGWLYASFAVSSLLSVIALFAALWRTPEIVI